MLNWNRKQILDLRSRSCTFKSLIFNPCRNEWKPYPQDNTLKYGGSWTWSAMTCEWFFVVQLNLQKHRYGPLSHFERRHTLHRCEMSENSHHLKCSKQILFSKCTENNGERTWALHSSRCSTLLSSAKLRCCHLRNNILSMWYEVFFDSVGALCMDREGWPFYFRESWGLLHVCVFCVCYLRLPLFGRRLAAPSLGLSLPSF